LEVENISLPFSFRPSLEKFTRDLTAAALRDELEPVCCREKEIERVITILVRQSKNNPALVGEAGVGKTAIVEGLAHRISAGKVPDRLKTARLLSLSHVDLIAGTSFRGQYEKRIQAVVHEASSNPEIILFIDELHNLIGAGTAIGAPLDAANMLKPALANGQLRVIGATTEIEYERYVRGDSALERRFQPVHVEELGRADTLQVLHARQPRLEMHHLMSITEEALQAAADLSAKYLPDRKQPDRSIDLLDETCASIRLKQNDKIPAVISDLQKQRERLMAAEREAVTQILTVESSEGTPLERFSRGTYKALEALGLRVEKMFTGQVTPRPPLPPPESIQRLLEQDPFGTLTKLYRERLKIEDQLRRFLRENGLIVTGENIEQTVSQANQSSKD
jgi:ATP-dependent Clp protease ATP-binding subunit ClpA